jgi:hypothetical protein
LIGTHGSWIFDVEGDDDCYDAISGNVDHSELFDVFGDYKGRTPDLEVSSADTWYDPVTPEQYARAEVEEATYVCAEHAYRVHHFDNEDFEDILLVNHQRPPYSTNAHEFKPSVEYSLNGCGILNHKYLGVGFHSNPLTLSQKPELIPRVKFHSLFYPYSNLSTLSRKADFKSTCHFHSPF